MALDPSFAWRVVGINIYKGGRRMTKKRRAEIESRQREK